MVEKLKHIIIYIFLSMNLVGCSDDEIIHITPSNKTYLGILCKATMSAVFLRPVDIMDVYKIVDNKYIYVKYMRPSDATIWKNRCKIYKDRIVWGGVDVYGEGSGDSRWRESSEDIGIVRYEYSGSFLKVWEEEKETGEILGCLILPIDKGVALLSKARVVIGADKCRR